MTKIEIGITHWAKTAERCDYLERCIASLRVPRAERSLTLPIIVSIEPDWCSPFNQLARDICGRFTGVQVIEHPEKGSRVDAHLDWLSDYVFDECDADLMLYVQDDFILTRSGWLGDAIRAIKAKENRVALRLFTGAVPLPDNEQSIHKVEIEAGLFSIIPDSVHYWSYTPAIHSRELRRLCGRFDAEEHRPSWEWKFNNRAKNLARNGVIEIVSIADAFEHIGERRTIPKNEQDLDVDDFSISSRLLHMMRQRVDDGEKVLELGSGVGSNALANYYRVLAVEDSLEWLGRFEMVDYVGADLVQGWYDPRALGSLDQYKAKCLLIDGPNTSRGSRQKMLEFMHLFPFDSIEFIFIDDTHRGHESALAAKLLKSLQSGIPGWRHATISKHRDSDDQSSEFSIITRSEPNDADQTDRPTSSSRST